MMEEKKKLSLKFKLIIVAIIVVVVFVAGTFVVRTVKEKLSEVKIASGTITDYLKECKFTGAIFTYNGIAELQEKNVAIRYYAKVRANVDFEKLTVEIDDSEENKITIIIPQVELETNLDDSKSLSYMPNKPDISLEEAKKCCLEDAYQEASNSEALVGMAKENVENVIKALLQPVVAKDGYSVNCVWDMTEGGNND